MPLPPLLDLTVPFHEAGALTQTWHSFPKVLPSLDDQAENQEGDKGKGGLDREVT